jgi:hypothetical protein
MRPVWPAYQPFRSGRKGRGRRGQPARTTSEVTATGGWRFMTTGLIHDNGVRGWILTFIIHVSSGYKGRATAPRTGDRAPSMAA